MLIIAGCYIPPVPFPIPEEVALKLIADPPFYPGEVVSGTVVRLYQHFALLNVRGHKMALETQLMSWSVCRDASSVLGIGARIEAMALTRDYPARRKEWSLSNYRGMMSGGFWLSRLPLLENPWPTLADLYPDGSMVDVELVDFDRKNDAIVRFPGGARALAAMSGFYRHARNNSRLAIKPIIGEQLKVTVRGKLDGKYWLRPKFV